MAILKQILYWIVVGPIILMALFALVTGSILAAKDVGWPIVIFGWGWILAAFGLFLLHESGHTPNPNVWTPEDDE